MQSLHNSYHLPAQTLENIENLKQKIHEYKEGKITADQFKEHRVLQGIYEQRQAGTFMIRVRFPAGILLPHQMRALSKVSVQHGNGILHVTTRQDIQIHRANLDSLHPALLDLYNAEIFADLDTKLKGALFKIIFKKGDGKK